MKRKKIRVRFGWMLIVLMALMECQKGVRERDGVGK